MDQAAAAHREAMELADRAMMARITGDVEAARSLLRQAFEKERTAALELLRDDGPEPTRSVLFRSAASLALECGEPREGERLASCGLAGLPPEPIADELRELIDLSNFHRHLALKGIRLLDDEFQMTLAGPDFGPGLAKTSEYVRRIHSLEALSHRVGERLNKVPYRDRGKADAKVQQDLAMFISVPRAASFAVSFRIGTGTRPIFPDLDVTTRVVEVLLEGLQKLEDGDHKGLFESIGDRAYYRNFVNLARSLAPDGRSVNLVGFTSNREGKRREVSLRRPRSTHVFQDPGARGKDIEQIRIEGELRRADSMEGGAENQIAIRDDKGKKVHFLVPAGMMKDIVRPLYESRVLVVGTRRRGDRLVRLSSIDPAE